MNLLKALLRDESGAVLSSELVMVGTVGVVGATVGLSAMKESVNGELVDVARAIRSLDQSYCIEGTKGCGAWTAGSAFQQEPVEKSLKELDLHIAQHKKAATEKEKHDHDHKHHDAKPELKKPEMKRPTPKKKPDPKKRPKRKKKPSETEIIL